jgi:hypothetical protein
MAVQNIPTATILFFFLSALATTLDQTSAFSTSSDHGRTHTFHTTSSSLSDERNQRIGVTTANHHDRIGNSRLFADASDTAVKTADAIPTDPAKTKPEFLAGLWRLIAKGNKMVRDVSAIETMLLLFSHLVIRYQSCSAFLRSLDSPIVLTNSPTNIVMSSHAGNRNSTLSRNG